MKKTSFPKEVRNRDKANTLHFTAGGCEVLAVFKEDNRFLYQALKQSMLYNLREQNAS